MRPLALPALAALLVSFGACGDDAADTTTTPSPDAGRREVINAPAPSSTASSTSTTDASSPPDAAVATVDATPDTATKVAFSCSADSTFPITVPVPEASAAAEVELTAGVRELLVIGDSGHNGQAVLVALPSRTTRSLTLPLDTTASDDVEGIAWRDGHLYSLTSSGAVRRFSPDGSGGLKRDQDVYRLGADPYSCPDLMGVNCGKDYEGLCLRGARGSHACDGYAASKHEGKLYCVVLDGAGKLSVASGVAPIDLALAQDVLSDCAFGAGAGPAADALVVTTNGTNLNKTYRIDEPTGIKFQIPTSFLPNNEAVAIDRDGALYVFDDHQYAPSGSLRLTCTGW